MSSDDNNDEIWYLEGALREIDRVCRDKFVPLGVKENAKTALEHFARERRPMPNRIALLCFDVAYIYMEWEEHGDVFKLCVFPHKIVFEGADEDVETLDVSLGDGSNWTADLWEHLNDHGYLEYGGSPYF
jgi:hypothetical protein